MKWYLVVDDIGAALLLTVNFPPIAPGGPSWPGGLPRKDGAGALSGAGSADTATTLALTKRQEQKT
jgi:hypothetical protein